MCIRDSPRPDPVLDGAEIIVELMRSNPPKRPSDSPSRVMGSRGAAGAPEDAVPGPGSTPPSEGPAEEGCAGTEGGCARRPPAAAGAADTQSGAGTPRPSNLCVQSLSC